ncbi:TPA: helix-turn-helix transcriptional regulator [Enterococcus faecalis]|nr:helix-turn-helix domain-containing protein [Enterococcus faecalis]EIP8062071.1 helix-turn-helix transcriptional regulator [Enterococcus faecalis]EKZ0111041.1 helix-turn-helix transcriptional regulator [Enterococcus faecalis]MEB7954497.1 helix-turn-helix transcriptional regulator [Enterococcus faecalis]MEB7964642.1 helix-turn-helix transcriptional regulator [Enterococcus faecalis]NSN29419.1 helix-turn-helix transcriptional regulator [Enterococcus faecalis]
MMLFDRVKELCKKRGISISELENNVGFGKNTIYKWKNQSPKAETLQKVADYFGVTTDYLLGRTDTPQFSAKNERDVQKMLSEMKDGLTNKHTLAYFKNDGEEIDEEDAELLAEALEFVVRQSKLIAKKKFTRKDYRKENHDDLA